MEGTEGAAARILVLSHPLYCRSYLAQVDHSLPNGIHLKVSSSPTHRSYFAHPVVLKTDC